MAGAGDARHRARPVSGGVVARAVVMAAAARPHRRRDRFCHRRRRGAGAVGPVAYAGVARGPEPARSRQRAAAIVRRPRSRTNSPSTRRIPIRWRCGTPMSSARCRRRPRSIPASLRRASPGAILTRCAPWCCSPASPHFLPPAASAGSASPRRSTGRAWCCRRISGSMPGWCRRLTPASRRWCCPAFIPAATRRRRRRRAEDPSPCRSIRR